MAKLGVLIVNVAIAAYLIVCVRSSLAASESVFTPLALAFIKQVVTAASKTLACTRFRAICQAAPARERTKVYLVSPETPAPSALIDRIRGRSTRNVCAFASLTDGHRRRVILLT